MQKSKKISTKINILLVILLISLFIVISIEEKNPNEIINTRLPPKSSVYYEDTTGSANSVYVSGDYAYVADGVSGLAIIDISDPTNPGMPIYEDTTGSANSVYVSGDYAYVADGVSGLAVIEISDPRNPGTPVYENTTDDARSVYVSGDYAYVADFSSGLAVIDISDPTNPGTPIYKNTTGNAYGVYVSGNYAYLADGSLGLAVINISDPTNPGTPIYKNTTGNAYGVYVSGNFAYLADGSSGLAVINISNPTNPGTPVYEDTTDDARSVYVSGDYAYVGDRFSGLAVIDISDPTNPGTPIYKNTTGNAYGVYVSGNYAYLADGSSGLAVIKITVPIDPGTPVYVDTDGSANGVYVSGDYAYVADYSFGLAVIDISDPTNPGTPVYEDTTGFLFDVYVSGDYAYLADFSSGLAVIDISDPTDPGTPVYETIMGGIAHGVYVSGDYAYVADFNYGLVVIDISDPTNPGTPIYENTIGNAYGVYVSGNYAYLADGNSGLAVINISNPKNPGTPIYENTTGNAYGVCVSGDYAYVADRSSGLAIIDISDPTNPGMPIYQNITNDARSVYVSGDYAYVADSLSGLAIIDISDPTNPGTPVYRDTTGSANGVYVSGYYAYVADGSSGLAVIEIRKMVEFEDPIITNAPSDFTLEAGYAGETLSWTATDANPDTYTIELQGSGIVAGPTAWTSGVAITYNIPDGLAVGVYDYTVNFMDYFGNYITDSVEITVEDTTDPDIISAPSDFTVEAGDTGQNLSWTATDANPSAYTIELQGSGIVAGPTAWTSGVAITYNIPDGIAVGVYDYTINFTDNYGNFNTDSVEITVEDTTNPNITSAPSDLTVEFEYTGQSLSWTATDANPDTYTIELQGSGIVAGPTAWTSGGTITYNIPNGFAIGVYFYTVNFTDDYDHFTTDSVDFTVEDTTNPNITSAPSDLAVEFEYTGQSLSWTATDAHPNTYTIELQGSGIVASPTAWTSGVTIIYNIPDGFAINVYIYIINFTDDSGNSIINSTTITVDDTTKPTILSAPSDLTVEFGYTGQSLSWTATDANKNTYTIELQGSGIVAGPTAWTSGVEIIYNIPDGFAIDVYVYIINFTDDYGNSIIDSVIFTVSDTTNPTIISAPSDLEVESGYTGQSLSWTATDANNNTYTIELQGSGIVAGLTAWTSGVAIIYNIPDGFAIDVYVYIINFTDDYGNSIIDSATFTVVDTTNPTIISAPSDLEVEFGYTEQSLSWTATDANNNTYTIELQGSGIVAGPTAWTSGVTIIYNIPVGFAVGVYVYTVNFTDASRNFITGSVTMTVEDTTDPMFTNTPSNFTIDYGYTGINISWTSTDLHPHTYTIELQGSGIVAGPTVWSSGIAITYNIPDGLAVGDYIYTINFTDQYGNSVIDTITLTVKEVSTGGDTIPLELIIIISSTIGGGVVIAIAIVLLTRRRRKLT